MTTPYGDLYDELTSIEKSVIDMTLIKIRDLTDPDELGALGILAERIVGEVTTLAGLLKMHSRAAAVVQSEQWVKEQTK